MSKYYILTDDNELEEIDTSDLHQYHRYVQWMELVDEETLLELKRKIEELSDDE